jgi:hypothetical protein
MATEGSLSEFSIPELFQFMQQHSKTGCLSITDDGSAFLVYFHEGLIVGVCSKESEEPAAFWHDLLVTGGYLDEQEADRLRKRAAGDLGDLRHILFEEGLLSQQEIEELLQRHAQALLLAMLKLRKGRFSFSAGRSAPEDFKLGAPIVVEAFLLDGLRMLDELPMLRKRIGSLKRVPRRSLQTRSSGEGPASQRQPAGLWRRILGMLGPSPGKGPKEAVPDEAAESLPPLERDIYARINGVRTIEDIIAESMQGEYPVCKALLGLSEKGWIELGSPAAVSGGIHRGPRGSARRLRVAVGAVVAVSSAIAAAPLFFGGGRDEGVLWKRVPRAWEEGVSRYLNQQRIRVVAHALELYALENGTYPETLHRLVEEGFLRETDVALHGDSRYSYRPRGDRGYDLKILSADSPAPAGGD